MKTTKYTKRSGKLNKLAGGVKFSRASGRGLDGHRLTMLEMSMVKRDDAVANSRRNRAGVKAPGNSRHVQCGCGAEGCVFVRTW